MPCIHPPPQRRRSRSLARTSALAAVLVAHALTPAAAQTSGLRGEVTEDVIFRELLAQLPLADRPTRLEPRPEQPTPQPSYRPFSQGAVEDEQEQQTPAAQGAAQAASAGRRGAVAPAVRG